MPKLTITEVAQLAGVSTGTVSRVLNGRVGVSERTRAEVWGVVRRTGFTPDAGARRLAGAVEPLVGVAPFNAHARRNPLYGLLTDAIQERFDGLGMRVRVLDPVSPEATSGRCAGFILLGLHLDDPRLDQLRARRLPVVAIGTLPPGAKASWVEADNEGGMQQAVRHLLSLGHRRIAHLSGTLGGQTASARLGAYRAALRAVGLTPDPALLLDGGFTELGGYRAVRAALERGVTFSALAAASDEMALGAMTALTDAGLRVPHDVSVTGFDDLPLGVPLTTVRQPLAELGQLAAELLLEHLDGRPARGVLLPTTLIVRDTSGLAPEGGGAPPQPA